MSNRKGGAVLFSEMTPPDGAEDHFNDWYNNHHMPSHVYGVPGFRSGSATRCRTDLTIWQSTTYNRRRR